MAPKPGFSLPMQLSLILAGDHPPLVPADVGIPLRTALGLQLPTRITSSSTDAVLLELLHAPTPVRMHGLNPVMAHG